MRTPVFGTGDFGNSSTLPHWRRPGRCDGTPLRPPRRVVSLPSRALRSMLRLWPQGRQKMAEAARIERATALRRRQVSNLLDYRYPTPPHWFPATVSNRDDDLQRVAACQLAEPGIDLVPGERVERPLIVSKTMLLPLEEPGVVAGAALESASPALRAGATPSQLTSQTWWVGRDLNPHGHWGQRFYRPPRRTVSASNPMVPAAGIEPALRGTAF